MQKDFENWNSLKQTVHKKSFLPLFSEKEIWWCSVGVNVGREEDGKNELFERPVLVFKKINTETFVGLPLNSNVKENDYYFKYRFNNEERIIKINQIKTFSTNRLLRRMGKMSEDEFSQLKKQTQKLFFQDETPFLGGVSQAPFGVSSLSISTPQNLSSNQGQSSTKKFKKIPEGARCVLKGVLHEVWQWDQEQFDGSFKIFECLKRRDGLTVIAITEDKKFIINYELHPGYPAFITVPGGNWEEGQTQLQGAQRELLEETGYESDNWELWFKNDILRYKCLVWDNNVYIARNCKKIDEPSFDPGEKIETKLMSFEEFIQISQDEKFRNKEISKIVKDILEGEHVLTLEDFKNFLLG